MTRVVLAAALFAAGCTPTGEGPPANQCTSDADCPAARCNTSLGMCVADAQRPVRIGLEVRPMTEPYGGSVQAIPFEPFEVNGPIDGYDLELNPGVIVQGIVRTTDGTPVPADLAFTRQSSIPGGPPTTITVASSGANPPALEAGRAAAFLTQLLPGRHELTVTPTGDASPLLPPMNLVYETPESGDGFLELSYPRVCDDPTTDSECLAWFDGQVVDREGRGQAGVVVKLVDRSSGRTISSRYVTATDPELDPGYFRIYFPVGLWYSTDAWFLRVSPAPHRVEEVGPSPIYTRSAEALAEVDGMIRVLSPDVASMRITYAGTVESPDGTPLAEASLRFTSVDVTDPTTNITGSYTTTARTDEMGRFSTELLGHPDAPATYEIVVTPSQSDTELGILRREQTLGSDSNGQLFTVPARSRYGGTVQTGAGLRMIDARVEARTRGSDRDGSLAPVAFLARSSQTTTDPMGLFDLRLDVGLYDVVIQPPPGTNFPWRVERDVAIGGSMAPLTSVYELDNPVPISGTATWNVDGTIQPVADGEVRAYAVIEADDGSVRTVLVGRATTDARGAYTLLLPPSI